MSRKLTNNFSDKKVYFEVYTQQGNAPHPVPAPNPRPDLPTHVNPGNTDRLRGITGNIFWLVIAVEDFPSFKFWGKHTTILSINRKDHKFRGNIGTLPALVVQILTTHDIIDPDDDDDENGDKDHEDMHVGSEDDRP